MFNNWLNNLLFKYVVQKCIVDPMMQFVFMLRRNKRYFVANTTQFYKHINKAYEIENKYIISTINPIRK